jgi:hypothetical protein
MTALSAPVASVVEVAQLLKLQQVQAAASRALRGRRGWCCGVDYLRPGVGKRWPMRALNAVRIVVVGDIDVPAAARTLLEQDHLAVTPVARDRSRGHCWYNSAGRKAHTFY